MVQYKIDKIKEDSFYVNLLLGLPKLLMTFKKLGMKNYTVHRIPAADWNEISYWEHVYDIKMPEDLRNFYCSTNGFLFQWTYNFDANNIDIKGKIEINSVKNLQQIEITQYSNQAGISKLKDQYDLRLSCKSKLFDLNTIAHNNRVVLVYLNQKTSPTVWLQTPNNQFVYLANDFTAYFRMCVAHLGVPSWQLLYTCYKLSPWLKTVLNIIAPHLLDRNKRIFVEKYEYERRRKIESYEQCINFVNILDPAVFSENNDYLKEECQLDNVVAIDLHSGLFKVKHKLKRPPLLEKKKAKRKILKRK